MAARPFVHVHVHSDYSMLDGMVKVGDLVEAAARFEQPALGLTDHGNLCGAIEFYRACQKTGVKPLIGLGAYLAPKSRHDKERNPVAGHHLNLIAQNETGYRNLIRLSTRSFTDGFYYVPRVDAELLSEYGEGLLATSACVFAGEPGYYARQRNRPRAAAAAGRMKDLFGDRYYLEIQRTGAEGQEAINEALVQIGAEQDIPVIATQGAKYLDGAHAEAHNIHRCIGLGRTLSDAALRDQGVLPFLDSATMHETFRDLPFATDATVQLAERVDLQLPEDYHLPRFEPPAGEDEVAFFHRLCREGAERLYGAPLSDAVEERLAYEQGVIERMGFVPYFLITWDFVDYAKREGIPVGPGRGSAAGSIVSYALGITTVDPLEYDLLFERFLNPSRISMPDIDIDFCKDGREQVIHYVRDKYGGTECVSHIITFGRMAARAVIRDVGRVMNVPLPDVDRLAKRIPNGPGATLAGAMEADPDLKKDVAGNDVYQSLIDTALVLEGMNRNAGKHAAGIVVADGPLEQYVPLYKVGDDFATQYSMDILEDKCVGLLKMDFLGLRTLTIIATAVENVRVGGGPELDMPGLSLDDEATYEMLSQGNALGVFQVEGSGMRETLRRIRPESFDELSTLIALYRPGPMNSGMMDMYIERKHGRQEVTYAHPKLEAILEPTRGVVVYQEQVMRIANVLGGFELADADKLRKAMGKKKPELLVPYRERFIDGCMAEGMSSDDASVFWDQLAEFAAYGFNKSHTIAYALITYQTAWLKQHYPREFMAALLTCEMADMDKLAQYIEEARRMGIDVLPPDVSRSGCDFTVEGENVRYGLAAIKGVGRAAAEEVVSGREEENTYRSVFDLCEQVDLTRVNRSTLEALARGGAFDATGAHRSQVTAVIDRALSMGATASADRQAGQMGLFGAESAPETTADYPDIPEWPERDRLAAERDAIGYYASNHPLAAHERRLRVLSQTTTSDLREAPERAKVQLGGMIRGLRTAIIKRGRNEGRRMAFFELEDFTGRVECVCFARTYAQIGELLEEDRIVVVSGRVEVGEATDRDSGVSLHVDELTPIDDAPRKFAQGVLIRLSDTAEPALGRVRAALQQHSGPLPVLLEFEPEPDTVARVRAGPAWAVTPHDTLLEQLRAVPDVSKAEFLASI